MTEPKITFNEHSPESKEPRLTFTEHHPGKRASPDQVMRAANRRGRSLEYVETPCSCGHQRGDHVDCEKKCFDCSCKEFSSLDKKESASRLDHLRF